VDDLREFARDKFADAQLLLTARAIRESQGPIRDLGGCQMILVLAPSYLDDVSRGYMDRKRCTFRFVRPDGSGLALDPASP